MTAVSLARPGAAIPASLLALLLLLARLVPAATAQPAGEVPTVTRTYAIEGARIVQAPGRVLERGTVVVRDGLILAVGRDVDVPFDAERIDGDSLTVYAGFIDGLSHAGIPEREGGDEDDERDAFDRAGLQADRSVRALLDPGDDRIEALRGAGFTTAHVVPRGRMLPGQGAIVQLAGDEAGAMILRDDVSLFAQFEGAGGAYPATPIGVIAQLRQLYHEAERRREAEALYAANPAGLERPPHDPVHAAFYPSLAGERPLFFFTDGMDSALEAHRALALRDELGFPLALAGLPHASELLPALRASGVPVFLTLDLPEAAKADSSDSGGRAPGEQEETGERAMTVEEAEELYDRGLRTRSHEGVDAEHENLEARAVLARRDRERTAADLYEAGIRFGFSTKEADPKALRADLRRIVAAGLPEDAALAALTTDAAALLGLSPLLGTVEPGKIANLVVTRGGYFDEEGTVRLVFVDGRKYTVE